MNPENLLRLARSSAADSAAASIDSDWPAEEPEGRPGGAEEIDDDAPLELDDDYWEALAPDDDYEPTPEPGDFWTEQDAA